MSTWKLNKLTLNRQMLQETVMIRIILAGFYIASCFFGHANTALAAISQ